jgi:hypothetical protein
MAAFRVERLQQLSTLRTERGLAIAVDILAANARQRCAISLGGGRIVHR